MAIFLYALSTNGTVLVIYKHSYDSKMSVSITYYIYCKVAKPSNIRQQQL